MDCSAASLSAFLQSEGISDIPIGLDCKATDFGNCHKKMYQVDMALRPHYMENADCEDGVKLYRRLLAETEEAVDIIEIGYPQVLAGLLLSGGDELSALSGIDLVKQKVNKLWMMAGNWENASGFENNFTRNHRSRWGGSVVCEKWPTEITFLGWEVGSTVITGSKLTDMNDVLRKAMTDIGYVNGRSSWDPMLCLMAYIGNEKEAGYDVVRGNARVDAQTGENHFEANETGRHCYVVKRYEDSYYSEAIDVLL